MITSELWHLPTIPFTAVDIIDRRSAATGSVKRARLAANSGYNGHRVFVEFWPHQLSGPGWRAEYQWGERVVIARGSLDSCLAAVAAHHTRGARGTAVHIKLTDRSSNVRGRIVHPPESIRGQRIAAATIGAIPGAEPPLETAAWWTGTHSAVMDALRSDWWRETLIDEALRYTGDAAGWPTHRDAYLETRRIFRKV